MREIPDTDVVLPGTGAPIASDKTPDPENAHIQLFKLAESTDGSREHVPADAAGLLVKIEGGNAARTQVADTLTEGTLLVANGNRKRAKVYNDSTATLYLGEGTAVVSATDYTVQIPFGGFYETDFTGELRGVWASDPNNGGAKITEVTA